MSFSGSGVVRFISTGSTVQKFTTNQEQERRTPALIAPCRGLTALQHMILPGRQGHKKEIIKTFANYFIQFFFVVIIRRNWWGVSRTNVCNIYFVAGKLA